MKNRFRRKFFVFFINALFLFCICCPVIQAKANTYMLDELDMSIDIPSEYIVLTRDVETDDPNLSAIGTSKKEFVSMLESQNIYLYAIDKDFDTEIVVTMVSSTISDFNLLSDNILTTLASSLETEYLNAGVTLNDYEVYQSPQAKFIKLHINQPGADGIVYGTQYYTVYNYRAINITMHSYVGENSASQEAELKSIVESVRFSTEPAQIPQADRTPSFVYVDKDTGVQFTVPANWSEQALSEGREFLKAKFISNDDAGMIILFGSSDIWSELSASGEPVSARSDINMTTISISDISELLEIPESSVSRVSYSGKEYFAFETSSASNSFGINVSTMNLLRIENGYFYTFQFSGKPESQYYDDFESLIKSVNYPGNLELLSSSRFVKILFFLPALIVIISIGIVVFKFRKGKANVIQEKKSKSGYTSSSNTTKASIYTGSSSATAESSNGESMINKESQLPIQRFCRFCGTPLNDSSKYCHKCGNKTAE